jgi:hypothetical protein
VLQGGQAAEVPYAPVCQDFAGA